MPTVIREAGFAIRIFSRDHAPPHAHVFKAGGQVIVLLGDEDTAPSLMRKSPMADDDIIKAVRLVGEHQERLLEAWRIYHA